MIDLIPGVLEELKNVLSKMGENKAESQSGTPLAQEQTEKP